MSSEEVIQVGKKLYPFPRLNYETDSNYFLRKEFFISKSPTTEKDYLNTITLSIAWASYKLLGCIYPEDVLDKLR